MKKIVISILIVFMLSMFGVGAVAAAEEKKVLDIDCRSCYLIDAATGTELYSSNADARHPIASMVKIMTTLLALEAIEKDELKLDEMLMISENSSGMGGSQMFLDTGDSYSVSDLMKGIIVASANDACVAIAERLEGSEEAFVDAMNRRAKQLNMSNTFFANCTGLPAPGAYSSAKDVSIMTRELIRHKPYFDYSKIWLENFIHPDGRTTILTNTNKLVRFYAGCDGGKTGYTNEAKFCLSATATKNDMRVISVVVGASESKRRFLDSRKLLDYAFANYRNEIKYKANQEAGRLAVKNGKAKDIAFAPKRDIAELLKRGAQSEMQVEFELYAVKAPVAIGCKVGEAYTVKDGKVIDKIDLLALEGTGKATLGDIYERILGEW